jgi:hypothetical protein
MDLTLKEIAKSDLRKGIDYLFMHEYRGNISWILGHIVSHGNTDLIHCGEDQYTLDYMKRVYKLP